MNIKYGILTKKINDVVHLLYPKSSSNMIDHNNTTVKEALESIADDLEQIKLIQNGYEYDYKFYSNCFTWNVGKYVKVVNGTLTFIDSETAAYLIIDAKSTEHYLIKGISTLNIPLAIIEDNNNVVKEIGFENVNEVSTDVSDITDGDLLQTSIPIDNFDGKIYINAIYATKTSENIVIDTTVEDYTINTPVPTGTPVIGKATDIKRANTCFVTFIGDQYCYGENWCKSHYKPQRLGQNNLKEEDLTYYGIDENDNKVELSENNWEIESIGESILNCIPDPVEGRILGAMAGSEWIDNAEIIQQYPGITTHGASFGIPLAFAESNRNAYVLTTYEYLAINIYNDTEETMLDYDLKHTLYKSSDNNINNYYILAFMFDEFINGNTLGNPDTINWLPKQYNNIESIEDRYSAYIKYEGATKTEESINQYDTYVDRLQMTITKILHDIPGVKIGFITPLKLYNEDYTDIKNRNNESLETWVNTAKTVCNYFNIPILDLYHNGPHAFYQAKYENYYTDSTFKDSNNEYVCYPNASTYRLINDKIEKFIYNL